MTPGSFWRSSSLTASSASSRKDAPKTPWPRSALLLGLALPIGPVQILWVNLITASTLGLALVFDPTEPGTLARGPRARSAPLLTGELVWHVILVGTVFTFSVFGLYACSMDRGYSPALAQTMSMK